MKTGLVSITFRKLKPEEIILLAKKADLNCIEWGGDIHVPHGDISTARKVSGMTIEAGLEISSYGSYYRAGDPVSDENPDFSSVLDSAKALNTSLIRIWAGSKASSKADKGYWHEVTKDCKRIAEFSKQAGIKLAFEFHGNTLSDNAESTYRLLQMINCDNFYTYWQPPVNSTLENNLHDISLLTPWLYSIHVFCWKFKKSLPDNEDIDRLPLAEGFRDWLAYFSQISQDNQKAKIDLAEKCAMLEFVKDDQVEQFLHDANTLHNILKEI